MDYNGRGVTDTSDDTTSDNVTGHGVTGEGATSGRMDGVSGLRVSGATVSGATDSGHPLAHRLLGLPEPELADNDWTTENAYKRSELVERIETASDAKAAVYELYLFLCAFEQAFRTDSWRTPTETDQLSTSAC